MSCPRPCRQELRSKSPSAAGTQELRWLWAAFGGVQEEVRGKGLFPSVHMCSWLQVWLVEMRPGVSSSTGKALSQQPSCVNSLPCRGAAAHCCEGCRVSRLSSSGLCVQPDGFCTPLWAVGDPLPRQRWCRESVCWDLSAANSACWLWPAPVPA